MSSYQFHFRNRYAKDGIALVMQRYLNGKKPVIVCVGTDLIAGDSLGPTAGTLIKDANAKCVVIGSLKNTVTAKEIKYLNYFLKATFPNHPVVVIDAAVGAQDEVGLIRLSDAPLYPGSGIKKKLGSLGDISIQGIVAERGLLSLQALKEVRFHMIYEMAKHIAEGVSSYQWNNC